MRNLRQTYVVVCDRQILAIEESGTLPDRGDYYFHNQTGEMYQVRFRIIVGCGRNPVVVVSKVFSDDTPEAAEAIEITQQERTSL